MEDVPEQDLISGEIIMQPEQDQMKHFEDILDTRPSAAPSAPKCWEVEYYQDHFNVSTSIVLTRLKKALIPHRSSFFEDQAPDLYGPFWVGSTLIFLLISTAHFSSYLHSDSLSWGFDVGQISVAAFLIYLSLFIIPLSVYCFLANQGSRASFVEIIALYGYSYAIFLPCTFLCIMPYKIVHWLVLAMAAAWGVFLYINNLWPEIASSEKYMKYLVSGIGAAGHIGVFLVSNLYFYIGT